MAIEHIITDIDSPQSLALQYLGDFTRWEEIVEYNRLTYPYIVKDRAELFKSYGSGYLTVVRADYVRPTVIKKGWIFKTRPSSSLSGLVKSFEVVEDVPVPSNVSVCKVLVCCTVPGTFGNVLENTITEVGASFTGAISFLSVSNDLPFTNGTDSVVLASGDSIYIPTTSDEVLPEDTKKMLELIGGEDLVLEADGDIAIEIGGDLASVSGANNIRYAVATRITTELGDLIVHPDYGTEFQDLIGSPNIANRVNLMEIAVLRALSLEDRIKDVVINDLTVDKTSVYLDISYSIALTGTADGLSLTV